MAQQAAHLLDHVLPYVPIRQWVLTLPFELRHLAAFDPQACTSIRRIYMRSIFENQRARALALGIKYPAPGAVNFIQRFDSALRLNVHFHSIILDGVYGDEEDRALHELPPPSLDDLTDILQKISKRTRAYLSRRFPAQDAQELPQEDEALASLTAGASRGPRNLGPAAQNWVTHIGAGSQTLAFTQGKHSVRLDGFSLYAGGQIAACAEHRLEKLCRYIARPPIASERLSVTENGQVLYKLKRTFKDGTRSVLMHPLAFLERLAALIPRPKRHLLTYHGCLAPAHPLRADIIPKPTKRNCEHKQGTQSKKAKAKKSSARSNPYIPWHKLMRRIFSTDVLRCHCGATRKVIAYIDDPKVIYKILKHLGLDTQKRPPPIQGQLELF